MEKSVETALRRHIRLLLVDYALEHLAIDHVAYSNGLVPPFLFEHLGTVSMIDGTSVSLPEDPLSVLLGLYNSTKPTAFAVPTERWEMTADNRNYLREIVVSSRRKPDVSKSLRELISNTGGVIWHSWSVLVYGNCVTEGSISPRPLSPPLSSRLSRKTTPKLNSDSVRARLSSYPSSLPALLQSQITLIEVSDARDEKVESIERLLNIRAHMTAEEQVAFKMLISSLLNSLPRAPCHDFKQPVSSSLATYFSCESPPPTPTTLLPMSPPLFPRRMNARSQTAPIIAPLLIPKLEEEDAIDWPRENMIIVDGWAAYLPDDINLPSLSPGGSSSPQDQIDELLWEASPEPTPEHPRLDVAIASARLDDFEIPRVRRFGTGIPLEQEVPNIPTEMAKILQKIPMTPPLAAIQPQNGGVSDKAISPSMVGQSPSSACGDSKALFYNKEAIDLNNMDEVLASLYRPLQLGKGRHRAPESWIMDAKIDEKDAFLLDVPSLPEPNMRPLSSTASRLPSGFQSFLAAPLQSRFKTSSKSEEAIFTQNPIQLGRVAGLSPLNIELSWRPIVSGSTVPTHEEYDHEYNAGEYLAKLQSLMDGTSMRHVSCWNDDTFFDNPTRSTSEHDNILDLSLDDDLSIDDKVTHDSFLFWSQREDRLSNSGFPTGSNDKEVAVVLRHPSVPALGYPLVMDGVALPEVSSSSRTPLKKNRRMEQAIGLPLHPTASHTPASSLVEEYRPEEIIPYVKSGGTSVMMLSTESNRIRTDSDERDETSRSNAQHASPRPERQNVPQELLDLCTLRLPCPWTPPPRLHKYIASLNLIQKRAIVAALSDLQLGDEIEDGPDIVIDPHAAVLLVPLARLPTIGLGLFKRTQALSWRFDRLMIVFEAYPISHSYVSSFGMKTHSKKDQPERDMAPDAFGPPVRAALKRLRREISIAREIGDLCSTSNVDSVFATDPVEAAQYVRLFGDIAEQGCSPHVREEVWDERLWMSEDEIEDEAGFASFPRMNIFAAITILSRTTSGEFLDLGAAVRTRRFGHLIGAERMNFVNEELAKRFQHLGELSSSPIPVEQTRDSVAYLNSETSPTAFYSIAGAKNADDMSNGPPRHYEHHEELQDQMIYDQEGYEVFLRSDDEGDVTMCDL
ncbi:hypothetical protein BS47DRAFT_1483511 [Hydnum rufescens UP504]|uniref:Uncharacterized protein n=1 Tax=Hydnum rufescens UP504 TaxID=1448309 RepID=A0A9P6DZT7_9AGAM|nr:hypothetical protein BS47DRAFT_1483511 [Hydnum rufescens UP504]